MRRACAVPLIALLSAMPLGGCDSTPVRPASPHALEEVKKLEDKVAQARAGQAVDFDEDGFAEYRQWVDDEGVRYAEIKNRDNKTRSSFTTWPDGSYLHTFSEYADGIIDFQEERKNGQTLQSYDTYRNGNFDRRVKFVPADNPLFVRVLHQKLNNNGQWTSEESLQPLTVEGLVDLSLPNPATPTPPPQRPDPIPRTLYFENPSQPWKNTAPHQALPTPHNLAVEFNFGFRIIQNHEGKKDGCTPEETEILLGAIADISRQSLGCLALSNPLMADSLSYALSGNHTVDIYCGFENEPEFMAPLPGMRAMAFARATALQHGMWACPINTPCSLKLNRDFLNNATLPPNEFQQALLHEFLHTLGFDVDNLENHSQAEDKVSSCARYCSGCALYGSRQLPNPNADCARCANSKDKKEMCGLQIDYPLGAPQGESLICGQTLSGENAACTQSRVAQYAYCDGSPANNEGSEWYCCETCPVENGLPCMDTTPLNLCYETPPACR
ncbi:MAG: hypothetical protein FWD46_06825 [Cystobacterineae bacterium]|nr:hypothetical protein [Cystobacterineae bacterium]